MDECKYKLEEEKISFSDYERYNRRFKKDLTIGVELEGEAPSHSTYCEIADELKCERGKGKFRRNRKFLYAYPDGSVNFELVSGAIPIKELRNVLETGIDIMREKRIIISPRIGAGCHQNICSVQLLPEIIGRNIIQIVRKYLPALCKISCVKDTWKRNGRFMIFPYCGWRNLGYSKYDAIHLKKRGGRNGLTGGLYEFRFPDAIININQIMLTAIINSAIVLKAISLSRFGVMTMLQKEKELSEQLYLNIREGGAENIRHILPMINNLMGFIENDINDIYPIDIVEEGTNEIKEKILNGNSMENGTDIETEFR